MNTKNYVAIINSVMDTPNVKPKTKMLILGQIEQVFKTDNENFDSVKYWSYINSRKELLKNG